MILVDSGSTDGTLEDCRVLLTAIFFIFLEKNSPLVAHLIWVVKQLVVIFLLLSSGHCVPADQNWLQNLCQPILDDAAQYTYGRQIGASESQFSECQIFKILS